MAVQSIRNVVESAIQRASNATGVDFTFLMGAGRYGASADGTDNA